VDGHDVLTEPVEAENRNTVTPLPAAATLPILGEEVIVMAWASARPATATMTSNARATSNGCVFRVEIKTDIGIRGRSGALLHETEACSRPALTYC
jgi:hypothetical protein